MSSVQGSARVNSDRRGWNLMALGAFISVAIWAYAFSPLEPASAMGATTGGTTGGTTGANPGYVITWENTDGACVSTGPGGTPSQPWPYPTTGSSVSSASYSFGQGFGGSNTNPPSVGPGKVDCSGTITATFTWDGDGPGIPAPSVVVLHEYSAAYAGGDDFDADVDIPIIGVSEDEYSILVEGERYVAIEHPGDSFQRSVQPWAWG